MSRSTTVLLAAGLGLVAATVAAQAQNGPGPGQNPRTAQSSYDCRNLPPIPPQWVLYFRYWCGPSFAPGPFANRFRGPGDGQDAPNFNGPNNSQPGPFGFRFAPRGGQNGPNFNAPNNAPNAAPPNNAPGPFADRGPRAGQNGPGLSPPNNAPNAVPPNNPQGPLAGPGSRGPGSGPNAVPPNANPPQVAANRGWLGVSVQPLDAALAEALRLPSTNGALVSDIAAGGPAAAAGLRTGDVITAVDGRATNNDRDLAQIIAGDRPNMQVNLTVWRQGTQVSAVVTLGTAPGARVADNNGGGNNPPANRPPSAPALGITLSRDAGPGGSVVVMNVAPNSPAARAGVVAGDRIVAVGETAVASNADVVRAVDAARQGGARNVLLRLQTDGQGTRFVAIALG